MHNDRHFRGSSYWTPFRGYDSRGHYDNVPHHLPEHFHGRYQY